MSRSTVMPRRHSPPGITVRPKTSDDHVFLSSHGTAISACAVQYAVRALGKKAGLPTLIPRQ